MSYDVHFDCGPLAVPHNEGGGTYAVGGTTEASLNVTYNYARFLKEALPEGGLRSLYGKTASEVVARLDEVLPTMSGEPSVDYWEATEGNTKAALQSLRNLAALCPPDAVLDGD